jgi:predicted glycosyltransferase
MITFLISNWSGLGHMNRTTALASAVREEEPSTPLFFVGNSPFYFYATSQGFSFHEIRDRPLVDDGVLSAKAQNEVMGFLEQNMKKGTIVHDTAYTPSLVERLSEQGYTQVLIARKRKDTLMQKVLDDPLLEQFEGILFPHSFSELEHLTIPSSILEKSLFPGVVVKDCSPRMRSELQFRYDLDVGEKVVTYLAGGGNQDSLIIPYLSMLDSFLSTRKNDGLTHIVLQGKNDYVFQTRSSHVRVVPFEPYFPDLSRLSEFVVTTSGPNVLNELTLTNTPFIVTPVQADLDDQHERAYRMQGCGVARVVLVGDVEGLHDTFSEMCDFSVLQDMRRCYRSISLQVGNKKAAEYLLRIANNASSDFRITY